MKRIIEVLLLISFLAGISHAQTPALQEKTAGMQKYPGFITFYWDKKAGKIWLEIDRFDREFLYINSLPAGLGSNDIGLDRNQLGSTRVVKFLRSGPKILLVQENYRYRANSDNPDERKAVEDAFARSVIWGFEIAAEGNGKVLVDAGKFYLRDAHNVTGTLKRTNQGTYKLDASRSAFYLENTRNFPKNTEVETIMTFTSDNPGSLVRSVAPDPGSISVRQRHSFVELPDDGYEPRVYDPRSSYSSISYMDYAAPVGEPIMKRFILRHRLKKKNPDARVSDPVEPIVYYVDRGVPEPVRSALVDGARWWNQAFEAAGYRKAFQVQVMPEGADPMDVRYNMINWVHRSTRGWSYGSSISDPRTGEIIKGHVSLGSLRIRQDYLIAEGLLAPYEEGKPVSPEMREMALARIRQLSVHEVGHTLGLAHNYISSVHDRASVMDYPHPLVKINNDGTLDLSDAYATGIGEWDKVSIAYGYQDFPDGVDEKKGLNDIIMNAMKRGYFSITDQDARPVGSAHPLTHLWDNGKNPVDELTRVLRIRSLALKRFSENNIRTGAPLATLEDVLVPVYFFHRYQVEAASKVLGGMYYYYNIRGDGQKLPEIVPAAEQRAALNTLLDTIDPGTLALDKRIIGLIPPRPPGYGDTPELFHGRTGSVFDPIAAAETAANMTVGFILYPERADRLVDFHARNSEYPGLGEVIDKLVSKTWKSSRESAYQAEIGRAVDMVVLHQMMNLAANNAASSQARAIALLKIDEMKGWLTGQLDTIRDEDRKAHFFFALSEIEQFQRDPGKRSFTAPPVMPNGPPIGMMSKNNK